MTRWLAVGAIGMLLACGGTTAPAGTGATTAANNESAGATTTDADLPMLQLNRHGCAVGVCPTFVLLVFEDGRVKWLGHSAVTKLGEATTTISAERVAELHAALAAARITERRRNGVHPDEVQPTEGRSNMSSAHIGYRLDDELHEIDFSLTGNDEVVLDALIFEILELAGAGPWM